MRGLHRKQKREELSKEQKEGCKEFIALFMQDFGDILFMDEDS